MKVKVRVAPSPTGNLHIGTAQSALYNWLFARKNGGEFHLRIEDTDKARSTKESEENIIEALTWLDLKWDGPVSHSTDNQKRYKELLEKLINKKKAFYCHHTQEELEAERKSQEENKQPPRHICDHKNTERGKTSGGIIRLAVNEGKIVFEDEIRGKIEFEAMLLGDFSIAKSIEEPLYNFAVVVDDSDMEITHVIRGEDHISNTPKQILIYEALGKTTPKFAHLPLILAPDRSKMSKRHGETATTAFKKDYLPEALINFIGTVSHTFSKEILTKEEMIEEFELTKVHKSGAMFDIKKLNWLNSQYVKKLSPTEFKKIVGIPEIPDSAVPLITERLEKLADVDNFDYFWKEPEYDKGLLIWKSSSLEEVRNSLEEILLIVQSSVLNNKDEMRMALDDLGKKLGNPTGSFSADRHSEKGRTSSGAGRGLAYWPLRVAVTGKEKSPDPVQIIDIIGKDKTLERIEAAINKLKV
ncbi:MAG: glutamate--tRNA ligase [Candidatus Paceibacterota bacterium]